MFPAFILLRSHTVPASSAWRILLCESALVGHVSENNQIKGLDAIKTWILESVRIFSLKVKVLEAVKTQDKITVTMVNSGNFDTSPQLFHYTFTFENGKISQIVILPGATNVGL